MKKLFIVFLVSLFATSVFANSVSKATVTYTTIVPAHTEQFYRVPVVGKNTNKVTFSKYFVRKGSNLRFATQVTTKGQLLDIPQLSWLKKTSFNEINDNKTPNTVRVQIRKTAGGLNLVRQSNFDVNGGVSQKYHEMWNSPLQAVDARSFVANPKDDLVKGYEKEMQRVVSKSLNPLIAAACNGMCAAKFVSTQIKGLEKATVTVGENSNEQLVTINWPAYTLVNKFTVGAADEADLIKKAMGK